jgi:DNA-binding MarR family transcriptional regulator
VAEPVDEPVLAVWEPVAVGEPVVPVEESPWQPAAPPLEPDPPADLAAHLDELAEGLPLAVAAVTPLLASSDHAGLTSRMAVVLRALADDPRGLPALARALGVSRPVVSGVCARLEALDLVQRLRDPADRRRILVVPTEKGLRIAEETEPRLDRDAVAGALGHLSAAELGALVSAVRALRG